MISRRAFLVGSALAVVGRGRGPRKPKPRASRAADGIRIGEGMVTLTRTPGTVPPGSGTVVNVSSIAALLDALAVDANTEIVLANGTYHVSKATDLNSDSLWIGSRFASRTNPVLVRAETIGGVTLDGGGVTYAMSWINFSEGSHHQTWQGFKIANGVPEQTGCIVFGGYAGTAPPHNITLLDWTIMGSVGGTTGATAHGVYVSRNSGHDHLMDRFTVDGSGGVDSAFHVYGGDPSNPGASDFILRNLVCVGTGQAIIIWDSTARRITIEDASVTNAERCAVRYEQGTTELALTRVNSSGSGEQVGSVAGRYGFQSSLRTSTTFPAEVTFTDCTIN